MYSCVVNTVRYTWLVVSYICLSLFRSESQHRDSKQTPAYIWPKCKQIQESSERSEFLRKKANCNCADPFAIEVCPKHSDTTSKSILTKVSTEKIHFGTLPSCECGQKYLKVTIGIPQWRTLENKVFSRREEAENFVSVCVSESHCNISIRLSLWQNFCLCSWI